MAKLPHFAQLTHHSKAALRLKEFFFNYCCRNVILTSTLEIFPGWPSYLGIPGNLNREGGEYMAVHPGMGIPGYLDKGVAYNCPSWNNPGIAKLYGNPGILGQGGNIWLSILG